jgi:hypothetical protein
MFIQSDGMPIRQVNHEKDVLILRNIFLVFYCMLTMSKYCFPSIVTLEYFVKYAIELNKSEMQFFAEQIYLR